MTNVQNFATHSFSAYQMKNIRIDQDNSGLFASVPDQSGKWMTVRCVKSKKSVHASHCSCHTFAQKQHCNHVELVQAYTCQESSQTILRTCQETAWWWTSPGRTASTSSQDY